MPDITTFLWYHNEAEEAARHYTSIFPDGEITAVKHWGSAGPGEAGTVMTVDFKLAGREYLALNGGDGYQFNEAVSLFVHCDDQEEVDYYWNRLTEGGQEGPCGWLKDRFGLSWQVVPKLLFELRDDPNQVKGQAVMAAMLQMGKIDSTALQAAYDNA